MAKRFLVVEDEILVALDAEASIEAVGFEVQLASSVGQALTLLGGTAIDAALLDYNLGAETCAPVADALQARGIPYAMVTAMPAAVIERAGLVPHLVVNKPADYGALALRIMA